MATEVCAGLTEDDPFSQSKVETLTGSERNQLRQPALKTIK